MDPFVQGTEECPSSQSIPDVENPLNDEKCFKSIEKMPPIDGITSSEGRSEKSDKKQCLFIQ